MSLTLVPGQVCAGTATTSFTGGDLGPGTRGMMAVTAAFPNPVTAGNIIVLAVQAQVPLAGSFVTRGPVLAFVSFSGAHSGIFTNYYFAVSYTDASGTETMATEYGSYSSDQTTVTLSQPNPNINVLPGAVTWSVYGAKVTPTGFKRVGSGIAPNSGIVIALSSVGSGAAPPASPITDIQGNGYTECSFQGQVSGGANGGLNAMGIYVATVGMNGGLSVKFVCGGFNGQPFATEIGLASIVAAEFTGTLGSTIDAGEVQQGDGSTINLAITVTDSTMTPRTTSWGGRTAHTVMVVDISTGTGDDSFFALMTNAIQPSESPLDPPTPTLTAGAYAFLGEAIAAPPENAFPLWFWYSSPSLSLRCPSSVATEGVPYDSFFVATGGDPPYVSYVKTAGSFPTGLTLNGSTGELSGTPSVSGSFSYTVEVTDSLGATADAHCTILVSTAHLTLIKRVNGPPAVPTDWTLTADSAIDHLSGAGGVARTAVTPGVFTLAESGGMPGYTASSWSITGTGGTIVGNVLTIAGGGDVVATISNTNCSGIRSLL